MKRKRFSMVELLVAISVICILAGLLLPALNAARGRAAISSCANNIANISKAFSMYVSDYRDHMFWLGYSEENYMERYVYGGRSEGNKYSGSQGNLFNNVVPRPLNHYVGDKMGVFLCPKDNLPMAAWNNTTKFEQVGNSYPFNWYLRSMKIGSVPRQSGIIAFTEAAVVDYPEENKIWHGGMANACFLDGHIKFMKVPPQTTTSLEWAPVASLEPDPVP